MIRSIHISNFQSHKDTTLKLDPGVNILTGQSDAGKTSLAFRAPKWVATNRPSGDAFRSKWGGDTSVIIDLGGGTSIVRLKGKGKNEYAILNKKEKIKTFKAMGTEVPEAIKQVLNLSDLSWQAQMDAPFLLSNSPGEVARMLNEVADLDKIDSSLFNMNRMIRENKSELLSKGQETLQLESELLQYAHVDDQLKQVARLKELDRKAGLLETMANTGKEILNRNHATIKKRNALPDLKPAEALFTKLTDVIKKVAQLEEDVEQGTGLIQDFKKLKAELSQFKKTDQAEEMLEGLNGMVGQLAEWDKKIDKVEGTNLEMLKLKSYLKECSSKLEGLEEYWHDTFPDVCPLCGKNK